MLDFREFPFMGKSLRVIMYNDTPYFVAADACELLGVKSYEASHRICRGKFPVSEYMKVSELITLDENAGQKLEYFKSAMEKLFDIKK